MKFRFFQLPRVSCFTYHSEIYKGIMSNDNQHIRKHLRVTADSLNAISKLLVEQDSKKGYTVKFRVSVFLYWLACGTSYRVTGVSFNISRYTVRTIVHFMLDSFVALAPKVIKYPSLDANAAISDQFNRRSGSSIFNKALGAIDGCHINIVVPTHLHSQYINRKLNYSINLMAVCDSFGRFINICCGYPGSVHDQRVLRNSQIYKQRAFPPHGYYLLGDSGYKCAMEPVAIITPVKNTSTVIERKFNHVHSKARCIIESAFGIMKTRWRSIFLKSIELKLENCVKVITACCVMHNVCLTEQPFELEPFEEVLVESFENMNDQDDAHALEFRNTLINDLLTG